MSTEVLKSCEDTEYPKRTVILGGYLLLTICSFGLFGNFICITVLIRRYLSNSVFAFYLKSLCISDTITLTAAFFMIVLPILAGQFGLNHAGMDVVHLLMLIFYPIGVMAEGTSAYITSSISVVRLISVRFPFLTRNFVECHVAEKLIASIVLLVCLFNIPRTMEIDVYPCGVSNDSGMNETHWTIGTTSFRENPAYKSFYLCYSYTSVMFVIPFATIVLCSICITISLVSSYKTSKTLRSTSSSHNQQDNTTTKLILLLCLSFMCSQSMPFMINIVEANYETLGFSNKDAYSIMVDVSNVLTAAKASSNFIFYLMFNRTFRKNARESMFSVLIRTHKIQRALLRPDSNIEEQL